MKIVVLGDSLSSQNYMMAPSWPTILEGYTRQSSVDVKVFNASVAGHTYYRAMSVPCFGKRTALEHTIALNPDLVICALGYNDTVTKVDGRTYQQVEQDAWKVLYELRAKPVLIFGMEEKVPEWTKLHEYASARGVVKGSTKISLCHIRKAGGGLPDGIHLNGAGSVMQAASAAELLRNTGYLPDLLMNSNTVRNNPNAYFAKLTTNPQDINIQCVQSSLNLKGV